MIAWLNEETFQRKDLSVGRLGLFKNKAKAINRKT